VWVARVALPAGRRSPAARTVPRPEPYRGALCSLTGGRTCGRTYKYKYLIKAAGGGHGAWQWEDKIPDREMVVDGTASMVNDGRFNVLQARPAPDTSCDLKRTAARIVPRPGTYRSAPAALTAPRRLCRGT